MMQLEAFRYLLTAAGQAQLAALAETPITPQNHLTLAAQLRRDLTPALAQAVLETTLLRQMAAAKFSRADQMYFTRPALEQATAEAVAQHRARRFVQAGAARIADLGCSIGGDAIALAATAEVVGVDLDPLRLAMAVENLRVYGRSFSPLQADIRQLPPFAADAAFFDPARRDERGRRFRSVQHYQPPLALIERWREVVGVGTAVKISPGVDYAELPPDAEVEFVSLGGEVKEALLWFDGLRSDVARRATLLPNGDTLTTADLPPEPVAVVEPQAYLYEPDGAVIRAHLVEALAVKLDAAKIDDEIAYLTAATRQPSPFARCFAIEDSMPFQLKRLRAYVRERGIGRVTVKKRGSPLEPAWLQRQLRLSGGGLHRILFLTFVRGETAVLIGQEVT